MKKLMIGLAAAGLCAAVFADGEVTSQNIVGYENISLENGRSLRTPTFYTITSEGYKINDIKPSDNCKGGDDGNGLQFQLLDEKCETTGTTYFWLNYTKKLFPAGTKEILGWFTDASGADSAKVPDTATLTPGYAIYIKCPYEDATLSFSGEVKTNETFVTINQGKTILGNPYPTAFQINSLTPIDGDGKAIVGGSDGNGVRFQFLDKNMETTGTTYFWLNYTKKLFPTGTKEILGWFTDASGADSVKVKDTDLIPAGMGIYVQSPVECTLHFKGLSL